MLRVLLASVFILAGSVSAAAAEYLFQKPALSSTRIVFSFAGDLWTVPRDGGDAIRLTTGPGVETDPVFSPDGSQIAFTGEYDGNMDVYVMPAAGGTARRLTYHPGPDFAAGWTPDGKRVLFGSSRSNVADGAKLFTMPLDGGFPDEIPLPIAVAGSYSADGSHLAYVPVFQWQPSWKRYRGGQTNKIWIAELSDSGVVPIPRENSNDFNPMWVGDTVYFLSDRNGAVTLYSYDTRSRRVKQLVENRGLDFKSASAGPGAIVYEQFGSLHLYDLSSGRSRALEIRLAGDLLETRARFVNVAKRLQLPDLSPNGARAVFQARGEIVTVPAEKGDARNLTNTVAVNEREPVWSPDGASIAYFSDESGEYALHVRNQNGMAEPRKFKLGDTPAFYMAPRWSPDSRKIAYIDNHLGIWYLDLDQNKPVLVDRDYYSSDRERAPVWSPDSKWIAYRKQLKSHMAAIYLYSVNDARTAQLTDGMSEARNPIFDKDGNYLYFTASTDSGASMQPDVQSFAHPVTRNIYLIVLNKDHASPLAPESDDEPPAGSKPADKKDDKKEEKGSGETPPVADAKIDFDNIGQRILALPMPPRLYTELQPGKAGVLYALEEPPRVVTAEPPEHPSFTVHRFDLRKRKADVPLSGVRNFKISFNGEKMLYQQDDRWVITDPPPMSEDGTPPPPVDKGKGALKIDNLEVRVDPSPEWKQIYHEVWRIERDYFYDPNYHGLDLKAAERTYQVYLENLASRADLNYLFQEMLGQMSVGHMFVNGGDSPEIKRVQTGLLGADYRVENGRYRITHVYNGENWNPTLKAPLTQPGVNVSTGDYLLAVNGRELRGTDNIYSFFEAMAGKAVVLKAGPDPSGANSREVTVVPIPDETALRHLAWIEENRRKVEQMTNGRVAYIYMPDTTMGGYFSFNRYFFAQVGKEAAIIDDRFNHGGQLATDIVEILRRPLMSVLTTRDGADWAQPQGAIFGPKVMIINEFAGSGGDAMPWYFKREGVGKLIGKTTWGGLVGLMGFPELMDGGSVTAPNAAIWNPNGQFDVENRGVAPDIEIEMDPRLVRDGRDPQLERAIQEILEELSKNRATEPKRPPFPNYYPK